MKITNYNNSTNAAFAIGTGRNPSFIGANFDYSFVGVALNSGGKKKVVTAVGPSLVAAATHYGLYVNDVISFINKAGSTVSVKVVSVSSVDDVQLAVVDSNFNDIGVTIAPICKYSRDELKGKKTFVFGLETVSREVVAAFGTISSTSLTGTKTVLTSQSQRTGIYIEGGDSGAPDFVVNGNTLELVGPHWSVTPSVSYTSTVFSTNPSIS